MREARPGPTSHTFFSQRLLLHYVDWGNPDRPPLLLIRGGRDHCRNWDWTAAALRDDWRVIALRYAGIYPRTVARLIAIEGLGPPPAVLAEYRKKSIAERMDEWIREQ